MTDKEFEAIWKQNKNKVLANDEEYQRILKSYTQWNWVDYVVLIGGFVIAENFAQSFQLDSLLVYLIAIVGMLLIWLGYRLIKGRLVGRKTLKEIEQKVKERYHNTLNTQ